MDITKLIKVSLILRPFARAMIIGARACLSTGSWPPNNAEYEFQLVELDLNPVGKWLITLKIFISLFYHMDISCQANQDCSSQVSQLEKTDDSFALLIACKATSTTYKR